MKLYIDDLRDPTKHLTPEQAEGIVLKTEWWEARNFMFDNEAVLEVIHFDNYLNDRDNHTGHDLFDMMASERCWGKEMFLNLKQVYLHSSAEEDVDEIIERWADEFKGTGVELIKNCQRN